MTVIASSHPGSLDTFNVLASGKDGLERYRILEDLGQYLLNGSKGDVLEIGVGESSFFLSHIAKRFNRRLYHCDISPSKIVNPMTVEGYLSASEEITYFEERDPDPDSFKRVVCFAGSSDELFKRVAITPLSLSFIDGDHNYEQAVRDFWNVWKYTVDHGYVLLHDTFPPSEDWLDENHCGDVWRLRRDLEYRSMDVLTIPHGTCLGVGLTIIRKREKERKIYQ